MFTTHLVNSTFTFMLEYFCFSTFYLYKIEIMQCIYVCSKFLASYAQSLTGWHFLSCGHKIITCHLRLLSHTILSVIWRLRYNFTSCIWLEVLRDVWIYRKLACAYRLSSFAHKMYKIYHLMGFRVTKGLCTDIFIDRI